MVTETKPLASARMAVHDSVTGASASGTGQSDATEENGIFGSYYYAHDCGTPYERNEHWRAFFGEIAQTVSRELAPSTVLDAGCAIGLFVEALRERGVEAYGVDVSEWAIDHLAPGARGFCTRASLADPLPRRYDLITCIEVLEHIPEPEASRALANLCAATDRLLLSTSPRDYAEATHVNVQPPDEWAARLAHHGFLRDLDFNATVVAPWAALFTRRDEALSETIRRYERASFRLTEEVGELRRAALTRQRQLEEAFDGSELIEYRRRLQRADEDLLSERDRLAAGEAQLGAALGRVAALEDELRRYELAVRDLERLRRLPFWGVLSRYLQLRTRIGRTIRLLLRRQD
jgi:SAM-dependent methyltransferase